MEKPEAAEASVGELIFAWGYRLTCLFGIGCHVFLLTAMFACYFSFWLSLLCAMAAVIFVLGVFIVRGYERMEDGLVIFMALIPVVVIYPAVMKASHHIPLR